MAQVIGKSQFIKFYFYFLGITPISDFSIKHSIQKGNDL